MQELAGGKESAKLSKFRSLLKESSCIPQYLQRHVHIICTKTFQENLWVFLLGLFLLKIKMKITFNHFVIEFRSLHVAVTWQAKFTLLFCRIELCFNTLLVRVICMCHLSQIHRHEFFTVLIYYDQLFDEKIIISCLRVPELEKYTYHLPHFVLLFLCYTVR